MYTQKIYALILRVLIVLAVLDFLLNSLFRCRSELRFGKSSSTMDSHWPKTLTAIKKHNEKLIESLASYDGTSCASDKRKIFNIGLPRTGTMSFTKVLAQFGFRSCHPFPEKTWTFKEVQSFIKNPRSASSRAIRAQLSKCDAFSDTPIYGMMEQLLEYYPDARFVMTTRKRITWEDSCKRLMEYKCKRLGRNYIDFTIYYYGTKCWDEMRWREAYNTHALKVSKVFGSQVLYIPVELPDPEKLMFLSRYLKCPLKNVTSYIHKQHALGSQTKPGGSGIEKF